MTNDYRMMKGYTHKSEHTHVHLVDLGDLAYLSKAVWYLIVLNLQDLLEPMDTLLDQLTQKLHHHSLHILHY